MKQNQIQKEEEAISNFSKEVSEILTILDQIEDHTANLRKKLISELKIQNKPVHIKLDQV